MRACVVGDRNPAGMLRDRLLRGAAAPYVRLRGLVRCPRRCTTSRRPSGVSLVALNQHNDLALYCNSDAQEEAMDYTYADIAKMIDHSLLRPYYNDEELEAGCQLALDYDVASVCIKPYYLKRAAAVLAGSDVKATTTIGFPHGGHTTAIKVAEAEQALADGAQEVDMVINIGKALSRDRDFVREDIAAVACVAHEGAPWSRSSSRSSTCRTSTASGCAKSAARWGSIGSRPRPDMGPAAR